MGGKSQMQEPPPPVIGDTTQGMDAAALEGLMQMMAAQSAVTAAMAAQPPPTPQLPPIYTSPEIDWADKIEALNYKVAGEEAAEKARRKGLIDTIHSGLLLDEEEPETTNPVLG